MKVVHFVTGGFSGATSVAVELVRAARASGTIDAVLVLRRKRSTQIARVDALRAEGLSVEMVPGWSHAATMWSLVQLFRRMRPDVLVAHGFPEHLLGRWAGLAARVPHMVQVEHNARERYTAWRLAQTRWLARRTDRIVGVSGDVRSILLKMGMPAERTVTIANGIAIERFAAARDHPIGAREPQIVMAARFAGQKDHATLLRALSLLRAEGQRPRLLLAGTGNNRHEEAALRLSAFLGLQDQVQFLGHVQNLPDLLLRSRIAVLSSHYEGFGLSLAEGMAAGCAAIGTDVPGIRSLIRHGTDGLLVPHENAAALAAAISSLLRDTALAERLAAAGRARAIAEFDRRCMHRRYEQLLLDVIRVAPRKASTLN
jgi:glycosyltransferase involved in cell wall biosynthesis